MTLLLHQASIELILIASITSFGAEFNRATEVYGVSAGIIVTIRHVALKLLFLLADDRQFLHVAIDAFAT